MKLNDNNLLEIHPWLLAELSKNHFIFFENYIYRLLIHLKHTQQCELGIYNIYFITFL